MLIAIYRMLSDGAHFKDLGPHFHDVQRRDRVVRRSVQRLEDLGYRVTIEAAQVRPFSGERSMGPLGDPNGGDKNGAGWSNLGTGRVSPSGRRLG